MTNAIIIFSLAVIFRTLSGFQNGFGYARNKKSVITMTVLLMIMSIFPMWYFVIHDYNVWVKVLIIGLFSASVFCSGWQMYNFISHPVKFNYIHDVETVLTGAFISGLFLIDWKENWVPILFAHFSGMLFNKIGVNVPPPGTDWNHKDRS